jgi:hypothetical protein
VTLRSPGVFVAAAAVAALAAPDHDPGDGATSSLSPAASTALTNDAGAGGLVPGPIIDPAQPRTSFCRPCQHVCSFRHPVCIDGAPGGASSLADVLAAADRAWEVLTETLGAPPPNGGIDGIWPVELADAVDGGGTALLAARDPLARFDRASSFAVIDRFAPPGCALDLALARAVARGSLWSAAPSTDEGSARAEAETLARLATPCSLGEDDLREFQGRPERALVDPDSPSYDRGASLFFGWLDTTFGAEPGGLTVGLWALAPARTPADAWRWAGTPTGFDVLRVSLANALWTGSTIDDVFVRFASSRATMGPPVHAAWHIEWPARARRLASPTPVAPTGASYVLVDRQGAAPGSKLRVEAEWEDYGRMRWFVVKVDAAGRPIAELPIGSTDWATHAAMTIESLDGVDRIVVAGVDLASREHPFDPDQREWEPHGWLLTLAGE